MAIDWTRFAEIVHACGTFLITSHIRPDCDALGSELAMADILEALGKQVLIVNGQATPPNLSFIDPAGRIQTLQEARGAAVLERSEVLMVLDTSAWAQLGPMAEVVRSSKAKKILLDHHLSEDDLGAEPFKDTAAEATGRLVLEAADALQVRLTARMARALFAAIATDTGWFRFASVGGVTYRSAARLIDAGAYPAEIYADLYERDSLGRVRLRGLILSRVQAELDGRLAHTYVLKEDFRQTGALPSDTEDVINMTLAIAGTEAAVILVEQPGGGFKLSFRSRCDLDCSRLAERFGGGGHKAAAGAFVEGTLDQVRPQILNAVRSAMS